MPHGTRKRMNISLVIPFLVIAMVLGIMFVNKYRASREVVTAPQVQQPAGTRQAVLFFVADGVRLGREAREIELCENDTLCLKSVIEELLNGPVGDYSEALPEGAALVGVSISGNTATVELNRAFADDLPGGSSAEMLAVYSLVDTVCVNFPGISKVRLIVEGGGALKHLDISEPLAPDYSLEQTAAAEELTGRTPSAAVPQKDRKP